MVYCDGDGAVDGGGDKIAWEGEMGRGEEGEGGDGRGVVVERGLGRRQTAGCRGGWCRRLC
uniref:Uncharacterized protein n=1 Tax=Fagus sylvatica TaxID=28930 RepID=A0A2N9EK61_FAGSY